MVKQVMALAGINPDALRSTLQYTRYRFLWERNISF